PPNGDRKEAPDFVNEMDRRLTRVVIVDLQHVVERGRGIATQELSERHLAATATVRFMTSKLTIAQGGLPRAGFVDTAHGSGRGTTGRARGVRESPPQAP